jgi:hypothetical protein
MLRSAKELHKCTVRAVDGDVGYVRDLYFDDDTWTIRYVVVDGAALSPRRNVLISPMSIRVVNFSERQLGLSVTCRQVAGSPDVDLHKPVSRQREADVLGYYGYPYYWGGAGNLGHVEDFLVDDESWQIRQAVIDTSNWWHGKKVLVSPDGITAIDWSSSTVSIDASRDSLKSAGAYDPDAHIEEQRRADYQSHR